MTDTLAQETWVTVAEGAEITGYHRYSLNNLVRRVLKQSEEKREIKIRKRSYGYEIWLPDLLSYTEKPRNGPPIKRKPTA